MKYRFLTLLAALSTAIFIAKTASAQSETWPAVFDPFRVLTINLQMTAGDWATVQGDESLSIDVPAQMWAAGESPIQVQVRRKSGKPLTLGGVNKVGLKVDINAIVDGQTWRGLKRLSLESGADIGTLKEGLAWNMHRMASEAGIYPYASGYASWVRVVVNGVFQGVYVNVEQRDKQFLRNRGLYNAGSTWLYKIDSGIVREVGDTDSPTHNHLCFLPFRNACSQPDLATDLPQWIDMQGMLTLAAVEAFTANSDGLFTASGKNSYCADFSSRLRMYFPWDLDTGLSKNSTTAEIEGGGPYATILGVGNFREQYYQIMRELLSGPLSSESVIDFLDRLEPILTPALEADPNNNFDDGVASEFSDLRLFMQQRIAYVFSRISPGISPPVFSQNGGPILPGFQLVISHTNGSGTIYYTLDGTDPRRSDGTAAGLAYGGPISLNGTRHVMARVRQAPTGVPCARPPSILPTMPQP